MIVACVLKSGGDYSPQYVHALQRQLGSHQLTCLTDVSPAKFDPRIHVLPLTENWPGWWSKLELFRPGVFTDPVLYLDLDTLITGNIADLLEFDPGGDLWMIQDLGYRELRANSGVMCWRPAAWLDQLYQDFRKAGRAERLKYTDAGEGDGDYISDRCWSRVSLLQDRFPGWIVSYKWHAREHGPGNARLVCFHGKPRPANSTGWALEHWQGKEVHA